MKHASWDRLPACRVVQTQRVRRLGRLIRDLDPFGHPLSVHNRTGDDPYRDSDWTTYGTLQGPKTTDRKKLSRGLLESHHAAKPLLAQETLWSGNVTWINAGNTADQRDGGLTSNGRRMTAPDSSNWLLLLRLPH